MRAFEGVGYLDPNLHYLFQFHNTAEVEGGILCRCCEAFDGAAAIRSLADLGLTDLSCFKFARPSKSPAHQGYAVLFWEICSSMGFALAGKCWKYKLLRVAPNLPPSPVIHKL
jgi:hypothetical protein